MFLGGCFCQKTPRRTTSAGVPHAIRTVLRTCSALDRPRAKALGRNWWRQFGTFPCCVYKKESGFGLLVVSRRSRQRNSRCRRKRNKKVTKTRPDVTDRKASPDAPDFFSLIFFGRVDPNNTTRSHRQTPPIATARSFQHAENGRFAAGGGMPPPLARGWSLAPHLLRTCSALVPHLCRTCAALRAEIPGVAGRLGLPAKTIIFWKRAVFFPRLSAKKLVFFSRLGGVFVLLGGVFCVLGVFFFVFRAQRDFFRGS